MQAQGWGKDHADIIIWQRQHSGRLSSAPPPVHILFSSATSAEHIKLNPSRSQAHYFHCQLQGMQAARELAGQKAAAARDRAQEALSAKRRQEEAARHTALKDRSWQVRQHCKSDLHPCMRRHLVKLDPPPGCPQERAAVWDKTGIVALRGADLAELPNSLWAVGAAARTADLGGNALTALPAGIAALTGLMRLRLSHNALESAGVPWEALASLQQLRMLALDHNRCSNSG